MLHCPTHCKVCSYLLTLQHSCGWGASGQRLWSRGFISEEPIALRGKPTCPRSCRWRDLIGCPGSLFPCLTTSPSPWRPQSSTPVQSWSLLFPLQTPRLSLAPQSLRQRSQLTTYRPGPSTLPRHPRCPPQGPSGWWDAPAHGPQGPLASGTLARADL